MFEIPLLPAIGTLSLPLSRSGTKDQFDFVKIEKGDREEWGVRIVCHEMKEMYSCEMGVGTWLLIIITRSLHPSGL